MTQLEVWIEGATLPGCDPEQAAADFSRLANIPPDQAQALITSGKPRRVKRCDAATAEDLVKRLTDIGVAASCRFSGGLGRVSMGQNHGAAFPEAPSTITLDLDDDAEREKKNARRVETERGQWRDEPKIVPALHGLRWFADASELICNYPSFCLSVLLFAYGPIILFAFVLAPARSQLVIHFLLVLMAPNCTYWGFTLARCIQVYRLGGTAEMQDAAMFAAFEPGPHCAPLLFFSLLLAPVWYALPLFLRLAPQGGSPATTLTCFFSCMLILMLGGSFAPAALALTPNTGLLGLARICWAGVKNWRAFLVCSLPIPLFVFAIGRLAAWALMNITGDFRGARGLRSSVLFMAGICVLGLMPLVAYCAARDIYYYEGQEVSPPSGNA